MSKPKDADKLKERLVLYLKSDELAAFNKAVEKYNKKISAQFTLGMPEMSASAVLRALVLKFIKENN